MKTILFLLLLITTFNIYGQKNDSVPLIHFTKFRTATSPPVITVRLNPLVCCHCDEQFKDLERVELYAVCHYNNGIAYVIIQGIHPECWKFIDRLKGKPKFR